MPGAPGEGGSEPDITEREAPIEEVWRSYKKAASDDLRNRLMEHYLHLVRSTAERMHMRLPGEVDVVLVGHVRLLGWCR